SANSLAGGSPFFWQWEHLPLSVGNYTASGNSLLAVGMPCAFYSQHLQLGVESYQKKLNIIIPETFRLMCSDELYKFYDDTLTSVRGVLHDIANNLRMDYLTKRRWSNLDRTRSRIMIKTIYQQLFERSLLRNLEKFIGGKEYENDFRLLERMI
nr:hypothetical protein [Tanacetum cinerariifolium]